MTRQPSLSALCGTPNLVITLIYLLLLFLLGLPQAYAEHGSTNYGTRTGDRYEQYRHNYHGNYQPYRQGNRDNRAFGTYKYPRGRTYQQRPIPGDGLNRHNRPGDGLNYDRNRNAQKDYPHYRQGRYQNQYGDRRYNNRHHRSPSDNTRSRRFAEQPSRRYDSRNDNRAYRDGYRGRDKYNQPRDRRYRSPRDSQYGYGTQRYSPNRGYGYGQSQRRYNNDTRGYGQRRDQRGYYYNR